jgi:preprotein translocase subunit SecF
MRWIKSRTNIDFLGPSRRRLALTLSGLLSVVSIALVVGRGLDFGIDFTGGVLLEVGYEQTADLDAIRQNLASDGFEDAQVQRFGADTDVLVRLPPQEGIEPSQLRENLRKTLGAGGSNVDLRRVEIVSPQIGEELTEQGALAMIFATIMIFAYVMLRFQWKFAVGSIVALVHDVTVTSRSSSCRST